MLIRQTIVLALAAILSLSSCGSGTVGQPQEAGSQLPATGGQPDMLLPAPAALRTVSGSDYPYLQAGSEALPEPWRSNAGPGNMDAFILSPDYNPQEAQSSASGLAWCVYAVDEVELNAGSDALYLGWLDSLPAASDIWIAVADIPHNRWDIRRGPAPGEWLSLSNSESMLTPDGLFYFAVILTGQSEGNLQYILYGDPIAGAELSAEPEQGLGQLDTVLTAQADSAGTELLSFDFDVQGDGSFEVLGDTDGVLDVHYELPDLYHPVVRANFESGLQVEASCAVHVINPNNEAPTAELSPEVTVGPAPKLVNFDASSSFDPDGSIQLYEWDLDGDGEFEFSGTSPQTSLNYGIAGTTNVTVRVTDKDLATDTAEVSVMLSSGWESTLLDADAGGYFLDSSTSGNFVNPLPFVVYTDRASGELRSVRATDVEAANWSAVQIVDKRDDTGVNPAAASIDGKPAVAYALGDSLIFDLYFQQAVDATSWGTPKLVAGGGGLEQALTQSDGQPLIVARASSSNDLLSYSPTSGDFSTWESRLIAAGDDSSGPRYSFVGFVFDGTAPAVVFGVDLPQSLQISLATDASAQDWSDPFLLLQPDPEALSTQNVGGDPALAFIDADDNGNMYYMHSAGPDPLQWSEPVLVDDSGSKNNQIGLASTISGPVLVWFDMERRYLMYSSATDAAGTDWSMPMAVAGAPGYAICADITPTASGAVIFYQTEREGEPYKLYAAVFQ